MRATDSETSAQTINSGWLTTIAVLMTALGIIAIAFPFFASLASALAFGWVFGIILGILIWSNIRADTAWLLRTLIGINLLFDGVWMLTLHSGQRRALP